MGLVGALGGASHVEGLRALVSSSGRLGLNVDLLSYSLAPHGAPSPASPTHGRPGGLTHSTKAPVFLTCVPAYPGTFGAEARKAEGPASQAPRSGAVVHAPPRAQVGSVCK